MNNTKLIASIKRTGSVPENERFPPDVILEMATEEMHERMLPFLFMLNQGAYDHNFETPIIANTQTYLLSPRASYGSVRDIWMLSGEQRKPLIPLDPTLAVKTAAGTPHHYFFQKSRIALDCPPAADGTLGYTARLRPSALTEIALSARVTAFDTALRTITIDAIPEAFAAGTLLDIVMGQSAHDLIGLDNAIVSIDVPTLTLTMTDALPTAIAVGDWVAPAGTSPVPQMTVELHSTLAMMGASRCLFALGLLDQKGAVDARIVENLQAFKAIMYPRGRGETEIAVSPYFQF